jgi:glycosyltransferase involved in cell wall biosynthesis
MKTVGVVIATYNGENFLNEQLQSIIIQTKRPEKIIIVDDCSTDRTKEIIKEYAKMFPDLFIFIQNEQNLGVKKTFEIGISACNTDYIALCDQDDIWMPRKISVLFDMLERNENAKLCFHDLALIDEWGNQIGINFWETSHINEPVPVTGNAARERLAALSNPVPGCTKFFSSDLKNFIFPVPASKWVRMDWWTSVIAFFFADPIYFKGGPLGFYRLHANQISGICTVKNKKKFMSNKFTLYDKVKREIQRIINSKKSHIIKTADASQRRQDMTNAIIKVIDECEKHGLSEEQMEEYNFLRSKALSNLMNK